jgi:nucleoside-diphosphate-sugar epimerase
MGATKPVSGVILLTGATGFIGSSVIRNLILSEYTIKEIGRRRSSFCHHFFQAELSQQTDYSIALKGVKAVIHIAAKAHTVDTSLAEFRLINTARTLELAAAAASCGVKRFIFLSSIGVHGVSNSSPFNVQDNPAPVEDYAVSKLEAEIGLKQIATETDMEVVIIRPPLVYGANAPGNFGKLVNLVQKNLPLPLGAVHNKRSLVALDNLVDLIVTCVDHPKAANQTFLVSDDQDVSTTELLEMMTCAAGKKPRLISLPVSWLKFAAKLIGKQAIIDRLCGNLQVDISHTKQTLGWTPPISVEEGIRRCFK